MRSKIERIDHKIIFDLIENGSRVLDLGCGDGQLLELLVKHKAVKGQGIELDDQEIYRCVEKGVFALHGDIDSGLAEYNDRSFDYVILNQSIQQVKHVDNVISDALRVGRKVIIGTPNFANFKARLQLFFKGKAPVTEALPYKWFETPNIRSFSIADFIEYCKSRKITVERSFFFLDNRRIKFLPNVFAESGIFLIHG
jgi:methionine biosynthesis protein MetW